jgi:hypothetical protein
MRERRRDPRASFGLLFLNKYIEGFPHLVGLVEMSVSGMLVRKIHEPRVARDFYAIELGLPWRGEERLWLWARCVRDSFEMQALRFVGLGRNERERIDEIVREVRRAA